jgi:hypothetical protein
MWELDCFDSCLYGGWVIQFLSWQKLRLLKIAIKSNTKQAVQPKNNFNQLVKRIILSVNITVPYLNSLSLQMPNECNVCIIE